jgi:hypothetical protein
MLAVRGGGETGDPRIDAGRGLGGPQGPGRHLVTGQHQHPSAPFPADLDGLDLAFDRAVADPLQAGIGPPTAAIPILGPLDTVEPVRWLEPRVAGRLAGFHPPEGSGEGPVEPTQRRLLGGERPHCRIRPDPPDLLQLGRLIRVGDTGSSQPPRVPSLLQGGVVQLTVGGQASAQGEMLTGGRPHPELVGPPHTTCSRCSTCRHAAPVCAPIRHRRRDPGKVHSPEQQRRASAMARQPYLGCATGMATSVGSMAPAPKQPMPQAAANPPE